MTLVSRMAALFAVALAFRLYGLDRWSLWLDETAQYGEAILPLAKLYGALFPQETFLSPLICHLLLKILPHDVWSLRFPSAVCGSLTVLLVWAYTNELFGRAAAWIAGLLACVTPLLILYSQEYRFYSLFLFFSVLSFWTLAVALRTNRRSWWAAFTASAMLSLYTHFLALICVVGLGIYVGIWWLLGWVARREQADTRLTENRVLVSAVTAFGLIGVGYLPGIPWLARFIAEEPTGQASGGLPASIDTLVRIFGTYIGFGEGWRFALFGGVAAIGAAVWLRRSPRTAFMPISIIAFALLLNAIRGGNRIMQTDRYVIFLAPPYLALLGAGAAEISAVAMRIYERATYRGRSFMDAFSLAMATGFMLLVVPTATLLPGVYGTNPKQIVVDFPSAYAQLIRQIGPNDLLLEASTPRGGAAAWFQHYDAYYMRASLWRGKELTYWSLLVGHRQTLEREGLPQHMPDVVKLEGRLWSLVTLKPDEESALRRAAGGNFDLECYQGICLMRSTAAVGATMFEQLTNYVKAFGELVFPDADVLRLTRQELERAAKP